MRQLLTDEQAAAYRRYLAQVDAPAARNPRARREGETPETCPKGHPWTPENRYTPPSGGRTQCRLCIREYQRRQRQRNREELAAIRAARKEQESK